VSCIYKKHTVHSGRVIAFIVHTSYKSTLGHHSQVSIKGVLTLI